MYDRNIKKSDGWLDAQTTPARRERSERQRATQLCKAQDEAGPAVDVSRWPY